MNTTTSSPSPRARSLRAEVARYSIVKVGVQYRILYDGVWFETRYTPSGAEAFIITRARKSFPHGKL